MDPDAPGLPDALIPNDRSDEENRSPASSNTAHVQVIADKNYGNLPNCFHKLCAYFLTTQFTFSVHILNVVFCHTAGEIQTPVSHLPPPLMKKDVRESLGTPVATTVKKFV